MRCWRMPRVGQPDQPRVGAPRDDQEHHVVVANSYSDGESPLFCLRESADPGKVATERSHRPKSFGGTHSESSRYAPVSPQRRCHEGEASVARQSG